MKAKPPAGFSSGKAGVCITLGLLLPLLSACDNAPVVASIDGHRITSEQLLAEARHRGLPAQDKVLVSLLDGMIDREAAAIKAEDLALMDDPEFLRAYQTLVLETLTRRYQVEGEKKLTVTDADIENAYAQDKALYTVPERVRVSIIAFEVGAHRDTQWAVASDSLRQLRETTPEMRITLFHSLAVKYSAHRASRYRGGDIGYLSRNEKTEWPNAMLDAVFALDEAGDLADLVDTGDYVYIVQLVSREAEYLQPLSAVRDSIRQRLMTQQFDAMRKQIKASIRDDIAIETFPEAISGISTVTVDPTLQAPVGPALN